MARLLTIGSAVEERAVCEPAEGSRSGAAALVAAGILLAVLQTALACAISAATNDDAYLGLLQWDSWQYAHIAEHGYRATVPPVPGDLDACNVGFFPGYPLAARYLSRATGVPIGPALLLVAQAGAAVFWTYLLLLLQRWNVPRAAAAGGVAAVLVHPAAFFLVAGYSESLFLAALLGFVFWSQSEGKAAWAATAVHGFAMTATRIVGLPLVFYPVFDALVFRRAGAPSRLAERWKRAARWVLPCASAALGGLGFFATCQYRFGAWDVYMDAQRIGWHLEPDLLSLLRLKNYLFLPSLFHEGMSWPNDLSRLAVLLTVLAFGGLGLVECRLAAKGRGAEGRRERVMLYAAGFAIFFVHATGVGAIHMRSMIRYTLGSYVLLVLAALNLVAHEPAVRAHLGRRRGVLAAGAVVLLVLEVLLVVRFTGGEWVA